MQHRFTLKVKCFNIMIRLPEQEPNSPKCNVSGTYECGACTCDKGRYGRNCECDGTDTSSEDYDMACKM